MGLGGLSKLKLLLKLVFALVMQLVLFLKELGWDTVLIGKDTRVSGYMLEAALQAGFLSVGMNVRLLGPLPTPGVAYLLNLLEISVG